MIAPAPALGPATRAAREVLADTGDLARAHGRAQVARFVEACAAAGERIDVLVADGVDPGALPAWIADRAAPADIHVAGLEAAATSPAGLLVADRVVAVIAAGDLLATATAAAVQTVMARPTPSRVLVLVVGDRVETRDELDLVSRGVWRLLCDDDTRWIGQDIGERNCRFWSDRTKAELAGRIERDTNRIEGWLATTPQTSPDLMLLRASYAIDQLAEEPPDRPTTGSTRTAAPAPVAPVEPSRSTATARLDVDTVTDLRRRVLARLDADTAAIGAALEVALRTLGADLPARVTAQIDRAGGSRPASPATVIRATIDRELHTWLATAATDVTTRWQRMQDAIEDLVTRVDWAAMGRSAPDLADAAQLATLGSAFSAGPSARFATARPAPAAPADRNEWLSAALSLAYGGGLAMATVAVIGPLIAPVIAATAVGAVGGAMVERRIGTSRTTQREQVLARAAVSADVAELSVHLRRAVNEAAQAARHQVGDELEQAARLLYTRTGGPSVAPGPAAGATPAPSTGATRTPDLPGADQTGSNHSGPDRTSSVQTGSNHSGSDQTGPDLTAGIAALRTRLAAARRAVAHTPTPDDQHDGGDPR